MAGIDILTSQLFVLGFMGLTICYITIRSYLLFRKGKKNDTSMRSGSIPLAALGIYAFVSGLFGQFTWPLVGSYNILYYDIYPLIGLLFVGFALSLHKKLQLQYAGFFSLLLGIITVYYGYMGYVAGLSEAPLAVLGLFSLFGFAGILGYPVTLMFDRASEGQKNKWIGWQIIIALFWILLVLGSLLAIYIGMAAVPAHLQSF